MFPFPPVLFLQYASFFSAQLSSEHRPASPLSLLARIKAKFGVDFFRRLQQVDRQESAGIIVPQRLRRSMAARHASSSGQHSLPGVG